MKYFFYFQNIMNIVYKNKLMDKIVDSPRKLSDS